MLKSQYIIVSIGIIGVIGLFLLPKSVVSTKNKAIENPTVDTKITEVDTTTQSEVTENHQVTLTSEQNARLNILRNRFYKASTENEKYAYLDSLIAIYRPVNLLDSIAFYADALPNQFPNTRTLMTAGDAYYEVFSFAMSEQKVKSAAQKAKTYYEKILADEPNNLEAKVKLGVTYTITATPMQGITMIRSVLDKDPDNQLALFNLGLLSMQSGQYDKAVGRFERLMQLNPKDANSCMLLAQSLINLGKQEEAIKKLETLKTNLSDTQVDREMKARVDVFLKDLKK